MLWSRVSVLAWSSAAFASICIASVMGGSAASGFRELGSTSSEIFFTDGASLLGAFTRCSALFRIISLAFTTAPYE